VRGHRSSVRWQSAAPRGRCPSDGERRVQLPPSACNCARCLRPRGARPVRCAQHIIHQAALPVRWKPVGGSTGNCPRRSGNRSVFPSCSGQHLAHIQSNLRRSVQLLLPLRHLLPIFVKLFSVAPATPAACARLLFQKRIMANDEPLAGSQVRQSRQVLLVQQRVAALLSPPECESRRSSTP